MSKRVLVVGGAGYVGSVLVRDLVRDGYDVTVYDSCLYGVESLRDVSHHMILADTRDMERMYDSMSSHSHVVYLAELVGEPVCAFAPAESFQINELAPICAVRMARRIGVKRFVYASSCSVYGGCPNDPDAVFDESSDISPSGLYAVYKSRVEREIFANPAGFTILRMGTIFGPSPRPRFDLVLNQMTSNAVTDGRIHLFGGQQWRAHVHVRDVSSAFCLALKCEACDGLFNVVCCNARIGHLAEMIRSEVPGVEIVVEPSAKTTGCLLSYRVSGDRAVAALGFVPNYSLRDGVLSIVELCNSGVGHVDRRSSNVEWFKQQSVRSDRAVPDLTVRR